MNTVMFITEPSPSLTGVEVLMDNQDPSDISLVVQGQLQFLGDQETPYRFWS